MNKFISEDIWIHATPFIEKSEINIACIAYVTQACLPLKKGDVLICDASEAAIKQGKTSALVLEEYMKKGVLLFSDPALHAKLLLTDEHLFIGSANLSAHSLNLNEAGIMTDAFEHLAGAQMFCTERMNDEHRIIERTILLLKSIVVEPRQLNEIPGKKKHALKGNNYWLTEIGAELAEAQAKKIEDKIDEELEKEGNDVLQKIKGLDWFYVYADGILNGKLKKGDWILRIENVGRGQRVLRPQLILKIIPDKKCEIVIHGTVKSSSVTFTRFKKGLEKLNLVSNEEIFYNQPFNESDGAKLLELFP